MKKKRITTQKLGRILISRKTPIALFAVMAISGIVFVSTGRSVEFKNGRFNITDNDDIAPKEGLEGLPAETTLDSKNQEKPEEKAPEKQDEKKAEAAAPPEHDHSASQLRPAANAKPGDLMDYNKVKQEKRYYAGKLIFSSSTVTYSLSAGVPVAVTAKAQDGKAIPAPTVGWDDRSNIWVSYAPSLGEGKRTSWPMAIDPSSKPVGTYQLYLYSSISERDAWEYSGTITVKVVE